MVEVHKLPMQPVYTDGAGVTRFRENGIVRWLLDWSTPRGMGLNELARMRFSDDERAQFAQLIGYSLSGYGELSYVSNEAFEAASAAEQALMKSKRRKR